MNNSNNYYIPLNKKMFKNRINYLKEIVKDLEKQKQNTIKELKYIKNLYEKTYDIKNI
tara:strand:+ start:217 stop:390 length:174 start_codon:yes stop_codon:yes gene_type:complete